MSSSGLMGWKALVSIGVLFWKAKETLGGKILLEEVDLWGSIFEVPCLVLFRLAASVTLFCSKDILPHLDPEKQFLTPWVKWTSSLTSSGQWKVAGTMDSQYSKPHNKTKIKVEGFKMSLTWNWELNLKSSDWAVWKRSKIILCD